MTAVLHMLRVRLGGWLSLAGGAVVLFFCYLLVLTRSYGGALGPTSVAAMANVIPVLVGATVVRLVQRHALIGRSLAIAVIGNLGLCLVFSLFCSWLVIVLLGVSKAGDFQAFTVRPFLAPAAAWQWMNTLLLYVVVSLLAHLEVSRGRAASLGEALPAAEAGPEQLFVRGEEELRPLNPGRILFIRGADDYAEIVTDAGTHLVRATLSRLAGQLGESFLRVHRSFLVNANRVSRAEPAGGGRLLLHMENGQLIHTSRAGARILRARVI